MVTRALHVVFLGCGFITEVHSRHLRALDGDVVPSYASRDAVKAESFRRRWRGRRSYHGYAAPINDSDVDAVVVGADAISTDAFVNKAGTRVLGEAANRVGTPFFVVAESYKWLPDTKSITAGGAFETIPNALVTDFLSDGTFRA